VPTPLDDVDRMQNAITANASRCMEKMKRAVWMSDPPPIPISVVQDNIRLWFLEWERVLLRRYADLINDCDQIIGKEWHFNNTGMRCPRRWERVG
jgi:hypothetical protein